MNNQDDQTALPHIANFMQEVMNQLASLNSRMMRYEEHSHNSSVQPTTPVEPLPPSQPPLPKSREPNVSDPQHYSGERHKLAEFVSQVRLVMMAKPSCFPNDRIKVIYAASFLRGSAFTWIQPYLENQSISPIPQLEDFEVFFDILQSMFGDPDRIATAERKIRGLKQRTSTAEYAASFRQLQTYTAWNDAALCFQFYEGLRDTVKDELAKSPRPTTLETLIELSIRIDQRLHERQMERGTDTFRQARKELPGKGFHAPGPAPYSPNSHVKPMELDATRSWKPLLPSQREFRMKNKLCLYCADSNHQIANCPVKPTQKQHVRATGQEPFPLNSTNDSENQNAQ
jgi:hypothetical protein